MVTFLLTMVTIQGILLVMMYGNFKKENAMGAIKGVLKEELENSLHMKESYEKALAQLPKGSLVKKNIKGHNYYYLQVRDKDKVNFFYKGKVSGEDIHKYGEAKKYRAKYRKMLSQVKKQIKFLRSSLRGKEAI